MTKKTIHVITLIAIVSALALIPSCGPASHSDMVRQNRNFRLPYGPRKGKALIYIVRDNPFGGLVKFNVYLDSISDRKWIGGCMGGQYVYCYVSPGNHRIYSRTEGPIASVSVNARSGGVHYVQLTATTGIMVANPVLSHYDRVSGKYALSQCRKGNQGKSRF